MDQVVRNNAVQNDYYPQPAVVPYRVVSFLPSATEIMYFLNAFDNLVGVTAECDWPYEAKKLPKVVKPILNTNQMTSLEVEREIAKRLKMNEELYTLDIDLLISLKPDIIITQDLCNVCSISPNSFMGKLSRVSKKCKIIYLSPKNVYEVISDIEKVAQAIGIPERGRKIVDSLYNQYNNIISNVKKRGKSNKKCLFIEWLNPIYIGGYWMGQILKDLGTIPIADTDSVPAKKILPKDILNFNPDCIIVSPCGRKGHILIKEMKYFLEKQFITNTKAYKNKDIYLIPECFTTKPGPRIVEGTKIIYEILYENNRTYRFTLN